MQEKKLMRLSDLILVRFLASNTKGLTQGQIKESLQPILKNNLTVAEATQQIRVNLTELVQQGFLQTAGRARYIANDSANQQAMQLLGIKQRPKILQWQSLKNLYLVAYSLGLDPPSNDKDKKRFIQADGLRAVILSTHFKLKTVPFPTLTQARDALLWHHLMHSDFTVRLQNDYPTLANKSFSQGNVMSILMNDLLKGTRKFTWDLALKQLIVTIIGAKRTDANELRRAILQKAIQLDADQEKKIDLESFSSQVLKAARHCESGRFGDKEVFVSHVYEKFCTDYNDNLNLEQFKEYLCEANNKGFLNLSRADLAHTLVQKDVVASEIHYLTATFHFVRLA